jgi:hypothetical protein
LGWKTAANPAKLAPLQCGQRHRRARFDIIAPHFALYVQQQLEQMFGPELVLGGGLRVYTTLDLTYAAAGGMCGPRPCRPAVRAISAMACPPTSATTARRWIFAAAQFGE